MSAHEAVNLPDFGVGEPRVRLGDGHEPAVAPDAEGVVGEQARPLARPRLGVDQYGVDRIRRDLPLPPVAALASYAVRRGAALEREPFGVPCAALFAHRP